MYCSKYEILTKFQERETNEKSEELVCHTTSTNTNGQGIKQSNKHLTRKQNK
jgi:hypothetical protein